MASVKSLVFFRSQAHCWQIMAEDLQQLDANGIVTLNIHVGMESPIWGLTNSRTVWWIHTHETFPCLGQFGCEGVSDLQKKKKKNLKRNGPPMVGTWVVGFCAVWLYRIIRALTMLGIP